MSAQTASPVQSTTQASQNRPGYPDFARLGRLIAAGAGREQLEVLSPLTGEKLGTIPVCTADDIDAALARARAAQKVWASLPLQERVKPFKAVGERFLDHRYTFADIIQLENGKARLHALEEPFEAAISSRYYGFNARRYIGHKRVRGAFPPFTRSIEMRHPWGVVAVISPWNYPLTLAYSDAVPALIAGNAVILKPSELAPYAVLYAAELVREAGLPHDLFQIVTGPGDVTGSALVDRADFVMFTGSAPVGLKIAEACARRLVPHSLELGGKNPLVVLEDVDFERALPSIVDGTIAGSGQTCVSYERLYVHEKIYEPFVRRLAELLGAVRVGNSLTDLEQQMGTLTSAAQFEKVKSHVDDAVGKGARVLAGGKPLPHLGPYFFAPTLLEGVTPDMRLHREETFGPVLAAYRFSTDDEAVALCNDSIYGLHASVYARNIRRAQGLAVRIHTGTVSINENHKAIWATMNATQGGFKLSGAGRRHGHEGIAQYTQAQQVTTQHVVPLVPGGWLPPKRWDQFFALVIKLMGRIPGLR